MSSKIWIGIGFNIKQSNHIYDELINANQVLVKKFKSKIVLGGSNRPHLNFYDIDIPQENISKVENILCKLAEKQTSININLLGVKSFNFGLIHLLCENSIKLQFIEDEIVEVINPLRQDIKTDDYFQPWREYSEEQIKNRDIYGNPHVKNTLYPHLTLGLVDSIVKDEAVTEINGLIKTSTIEINSIDLIIHDNDGKFIKEESYQFKK